MYELFITWLPKYWKIQLFKFAVMLESELKSSTLIWLSKFTIIISPLFAAILKIKWINKKIQKLVQKLSPLFVQFEFFFSPNTVSNLGQTLAQICQQKIVKKKNLNKFFFSFFTMLKFPGKIEWNFSNLHYTQYPRHNSRHL